MMEGSYLTTSDIVNWIDEWSLAHPSYMDTDIEVFAEDLIGKIGQMDFLASNNGTAIGYAGTIGDCTGIYRTVEKITGVTNSKYSFINQCAENIQNQPTFKKALFDAVGPDNFDDIMGGKWTDGNRSRTSFGDTLSINDFVSDNYMLNNARGDVQLIITDTARMDSVLNVTELERLLKMDAVTHINGIPKTKLQNMDSITRFNMLKEQSVLGLSNAKVFVNAEGIKILSLEYMIVLNLNEDRKANYFGVILKESNFY